MKLYIWNHKKVELTKIKLKTILTSITGIIILFMLFAGISYYFGFKCGKKSKIMEKDVVLLYMGSENASFSPKNFYDFLIKINMKFPNIVFAQAYKECGFKSKIFKENHNLFGMKEANVRPNMQSGAQNSHAYFDTWKQSVIDYALYQSYMGISKIKTEEEYLNFLKEMNYYDTTTPNNNNYINDVRNISNNIERYLK